MCVCVWYGSCCAVRRLYLAGGMCSLLPYGICHYAFIYIKKEEVCVHSLKKKGEKELNLVSIN